MDSVSAEDKGHRWHRRLDTISGGLLFFLAVFAPWGAGGTLPWARVWMVAIGWTLGLLTLSKWAVEHVTPFKTHRWRREQPSRWPIQLMGIFTMLLVAQMSISLCNWRSEIELTNTGVQLRYHDVIAWLPSTYDRLATRGALLQSIGFAGVFWAMRDWLRIRTFGNARESGLEIRDDVPHRLHRMIWVLSINGALMGVIGILQRLDRSHQLLWLIDLPKSRGSTFFGSFPYRGNAAQYLNLIWPLGLGLWWDLRSKERNAPGEIRTGQTPRPFLLLTTALTIIAAIMAGSRAGVGVTLALVGIGGVGTRLRGVGSRWGMGLTLLGALCLSWFLSSESLRSRFEQTFVDETLGGRTPIYESARRIIDEFPLWGTGAASFMHVSFLYRKDVNAEWAGYVHNDWLETRVTLGWVGFILTLGLLLSAILSKRRASCIPVHWRTSRFIALGLFGLLAHAFIDFPFQIPAIQLTFLLVLALFSVARESSSRELSKNSPHRPTNHSIRPPLPR
jgi:O-antigen ligase